MQPLWKSVWQYLLKLKLPHDPASTLLGIYLREMSLYVIQKKCTGLFFVNPKLELTQMFTSSRTDRLQHIHTMEYYTEIKRTNS